MSDHGKRKTLGYVRKKAEEGRVSNNFINI